MEGSGAVGVDEVEYAAALTPFSRLEQGRLVRYAVRADRLARCSFWGRQQGMTWKGGEGLPLTVESKHDDPFDEATDAMFQRLRHFYQQGGKRAASFDRIVALLRKHASATPDGDKLRQLLTDCVDVVERAATTGPGIGLAMEHTGADGETTSTETLPRQAFEDWLYGEYLHDDEDRLARIDPWRPLGAHFFIAVAVATDLARVYIWFATNVVNRVLAEAPLFPPPLDQPTP